MTKLDYGLFGSALGVAIASYISFSLLPKIGAFAKLPIGMMVATVWIVLAAGGALGYIALARPRAQIAS